MNVPQVTDDLDTSNFDVDDDSETPSRTDCPAVSGTTPFTGNHLPFIGFTYTEKSRLADNVALVEDTTAELYKQIDNLKTDLEREQAMKNISDSGGDSAALNFALAEQNSKNEAEIASLKATAERQVVKIDYRFGSSNREMYLLLFFHAFYSNLCARSSERTAMRLTSCQKCRIRSNRRSVKSGRSHLTVETLTRS